MDSFINEQLKNYKLDEANFADSNASKNFTYDSKSSAFYEGDVSIVREKKTKKLYYRITITSDNNICKFIERYKYFVYLADNKIPFGEFKGFSTKEDKNIIYYAYNPKTTLQSLLSDDPDEILDDTAKSKTVIAVAAALEYCHALGICCRFIHPESICYDDDNNPYIVNIGYSNSIYNAPNSTFNTKMINTENSLFTNIADYVSPELKKDINAATFSSDVYAFGTLLNIIAASNKKNANKKIFEIIEKCHLNNPDERYTSTEILKQFIELSDPLFKDCKMKTYNNYQKQILENIYYNAKPSNKDNRSLFVYSTRLLDQNLHLNLKDKANILQKLITSANSNYIPAIYRLSLFLDSNIDTSIYDSKKPQELYDPLHWMKKLASYEFFRAPLVLSEMYNQRGLFKKADEVYRVNPRNHLCKIKLLIPGTSNIRELGRIAYKARRNPDISLEAKVLAEIKKIRNKEIEIEDFKANMEKLMENNLNGKIPYLLAVLYRNGSIPDDVIMGVDGILPLSKVEGIDEDDDDNQPLIDRKEEEYLKYLKDASDLFYEPAVAEYALYLLSKKKIEECKSLIDSFFSRYKCKYDYSKLRIQYAYAKLCEKIGETNDEEKMIKRAIHIYKFTADRGYIRSNADYARLYSVRKDANHVLINYYQKRSQPAK